MYKLLHYWTSYELLKEYNNVISPNFCFIYNGLSGKELCMLICNACINNISCGSLCHEINNISHGSLWRMYKRGHTHTDEEYDTSDEK